jgi:predicted porin
MKKTLVAIAALAAFGAQAQSSVTIYGVADIGYGAKQIEGNTGIVQQKQTGVMDGGYAGNRIGFKGTEDLGAGKAAGFVIEQGISPTNGALFGVRTASAGMQLDGFAGSTGRFDQGTGGGYSQGTNRQSFVSFADKSLGEVRAGYQYTALYEVSTLMGFTQTSEGVYGGAQSHTFGQGAAGGTRANGIQYIAPRMGAFGVAIQTGSTGGRDTTETVSASTATGLTQDKNKRTSLKLDFAQGPWAAAFAQTSFHSAQSAKAAAATNLNSMVGSGATAIVQTFNVYGALTSVGGSPAGDSNYQTKLNQIAGSYDAGQWKVGFTKNSGTMNVTAQPTPTFGTAPSSASGNKIGNYKIDSQALSGLYKMGNYSFIAGYGTAKLTNDAEAAGVVSQDYKQKQIGAMYDFSKRTKLYGYQGQWTNEPTTASTTAAKGKQTIVGLLHTF